ncbi:unnamed protein product [Rotaria sp. Silwood1]|nr:unnamed protein product [Rotaria sp. Silwood1]CAF4703480.1 unnamed protein product [Rotaria sp. Silwood1]
MFQENVNFNYVPYNYGPLNEYTVLSPYQIGKQNLTGGKTSIIVIGAFAAVILIGMALGLGLGIGAAGLVNNAQLINVTNTTSGR